MSYMPHIRYSVLEKWARNMYDNILPGHASAYTGSDFSNLERITLTQERYVINLDNEKRIRIYETSENYKGASNPKNYYTRSQEEQIHIFNPDNFLREDRPPARFIGATEEVQEIVGDVFQLTTGKKLPEDISLNVCTAEKFKSIHLKHNGRWSPGIQGFAVNTKGIKRVFVKENPLDALLLVIGHEIGHVLSLPLARTVDEEAKAFAFELAWMDTIYRNDIAGLKKSLNFDFRPAENGIHDIAFRFVRELWIKGKNAMEIFSSLARGFLSVDTLQVIYLE